MLLLPRLHADPLLPEGALQVPAGRVPVRPAGARRTGAAAGTSPSSSWPTPASSTTSRYFDVFAEYAKAAPDDIADPHHGRQPRAGGGAAPPAAHALVPQHLVLGPRRARATGRRPTHRRRRRRRDRRRARRAGPLPSCGADADRTDRRPSCSSPRTRRTPQRLFGAPNAQPLREGRVPRRRDPGRRGRGEPGARRARRPPSTTCSSIPAGGRASCVRLRLAAAECRRREAVRRRASTHLRASASARPTSSTPTRLPAGCDRGRAARAAAGATPGCSGPSSSTTTSCEDWLEGDPAQPPPPGRPPATAATPTGRTCSTATSSRCPTSGSTPGTPPGTWRST